MCKAGRDTPAVTAVKSVVFFFKSVGKLSTNARHTFQILKGTYHISFTSQLYTTFWCSIMQIIKFMETVLAFQWRNSQTAKNDSLN